MKTSWRRFVGVFVAVVALSGFGSAGNLYAQDSNRSGMNRVDKKGRKQGVWEKVNPVSGKRYRGSFKDDMPEGLFHYWTADSVLEAEAFYFRGGYASYNRFYYPSGALMADGYYLDKLKDSSWRYFAGDGRLLKSETFEQGLLNGPSVLYTDSGTVSEKQTWFRGLRNGPWFIHDEAGYQMYAYKLNLTHGAYKAFYPDSARFIEGVYEDGVKEGLWRFYLPVLPGALGPGSGSGSGSGDLYREDTYRHNELVSRVFYLRIEGELRAVNMDTVPLIMKAPRGGAAEILALSGRCYMCSEKFETVCGIFGNDFYFFANKNTLVSYTALDASAVAEVLPEEEESDLTDGQQDPLQQLGKSGSGVQVRLPLKVETPFPVYLDADGVDVLRGSLRRGEVAPE